MLIRIALLALGVGLLSAPPGIAQDTTSADRPPRSVSLQADGGIGVGLWTRLSPGADVGVNVGISFESLSDDQVDQDLLIVQLEPAVKRYLSASAAFFPYLYGSVFGSYGRVSAETGGGGSPVEVADKQRRLGASAAAGLDWFPAQRISLGGHVGLAAGYQSNQVGGQFTGEQEQSGIFFNTLSSGIRIHLYF